MSNEEKEKKQEEKKQEEKKQEEKIPPRPKFQPKMVYENCIIDDFKKVKGQNGKDSNAKETEVTSE